MINKDEFLREEKDCANMLGVSVEEYRKSLTQTKPSQQEKQNGNFSYDNSITNYLGFDDDCLKKRKDEV